ncbi:sulfite dehydrogenase [Congregibacter sp.]|uniref:sulfite dehydrogenase n=1 Tax=Congregibacter sp. TaxID=2744308 RepID=UPI0038598B07
MTGPNKLIAGQSSRRQFLARAGAVGGAMSGAVVGGAFADARLLGTDPTAVQGRAPQPRGQRSPFESLERVPAFNIVSLTPLEELHGTITPSDLHFERHHAGIPQIDPGRHRLMLHGMVERPLVFTLEDLKRFPAVTRTCFIECSGNLNVNATEKSTPQMLCGLTSQSEWTGVSLRTLLREVGVKPGATWCLAEGSDAAVMARSIPMEKLLDDAMVAYAQNGEALRPAQGYPMRLLLPGWEGNTNVKWLRRLELSDAPFMTREETSKYTDPLKDGVARQFSVVMDARSVITSPTYPKQLEPGWSEIRGIAWSGRGKIVAVEVSTDGGKTWDRASLQRPVLPKAHTRFGLPWKWDGKSTEIASRAIDDTGYVQPTRKQLIDARGPGNQLYHLNPVMHWIVESDGRVLYKAEPWA